MSDRAADPIVIGETEDIPWSRRKVDILHGKLIYVAGHLGMVGQAVLRRLAAEACRVVVASRRELDLCDAVATGEFFRARRPDVVIVAAGRVGGIAANDAQPVEFLRDNILIAVNTIGAAHAAGVDKLLFLGSSCIYPRDAAQPIREQQLLDGPLEPTNQWYALAKICGVKLCDAYRRQHGSDFISLMPTNLYGPGDNYHREHSHVPAALIRRLHEAKVANDRQVTIWGTGTPRREFMHVDDIADACIFALKHWSGEGALNVGTGVDLSIREFAEQVADIVGYRGSLIFDPRRPDGSPRKLLDVSRLAKMGWRARIPLSDGLRDAYAWYLSHSYDSADDYHMQEALAS